MRYIFYLLLVSLLAAVSCMEEDLPGYDQAINPIWEYNFNVGLTGGISPVVTSDKVLYSALITPESTSNDRLIALAKEDGDLIWEWQDHFRPTYQTLDRRSLKPVYEGKIAISLGGRNFCIDLSTGQTIWKNLGPEDYTSSSELVNLGSKLYRSFIDTNNGEQREGLLEADFLTGNWREIFSISGGDSIRQGVEVPVFYLEPDGDTIMIFTNTKSDWINRVIIPTLISHNKTKDSTYYDVVLSTPAVGNAVDYFPVIREEKVYLSVNRLFTCVDLYTGERIWQTALNANLLRSNFLVLEDRIYAITEGTDPSLYCMSAESGSVIWKIPVTSGGQSKVQHYRGVLYFAGYYLHAVDATTGDVLAVVTAPSAYSNDSDFFSSRCTVDPETGYIYTVSQSTAYCYPPLR